MTAEGLTFQVFFFLQETRQAKKEESRKFAKVGVSVSSQTSVCVCECVCVCVRARVRVCVCEWRRRGNSQNLQNSQCAKFAKKKKFFFANFANFFFAKL